MFRSILVPLDGSTLAEQALPPAAERYTAALNLAVVHPWGPPEAAPISGTGRDRECRDTEGAYLNRLVQAVTSAYHLPMCEAVLDGATGPALVEFARRRVDLVVVSTHGRGPLGRFVLGGVAHHVVHHLGASVLLLKPQAAAVPLPAFGGFVRVLLATDGSVQAEAALERRRGEAERYLATLVSRLTARGIGVETMVTVAANPAAAILSQASRSGADLIALTTRERRPAERVPFGSVADAVVHHAEIPVLVCHASVCHAGD